MQGIVAQLANLLRSTCRGLRNGPPFRYEVLYTMGSANGAATRLPLGGPLVRQ